MNKNKLIKNFKKIWLILTISIFSLSLNSNTTHAADEEIEVDFNIIPKLTDQEIKDANKQIEIIWATWKQVWKNYNTIASSWMSTPEQMATWIMDRNTIMNYLVFVVQFLSQLGLLVWAGFIIYAWYKYMLSVLNWLKWASSAPIKNAIIWIIIIIFSYAIMKTLTSFIWLS